MGETTGISWTEATWNPWLGCTKVSPGCLPGDNCYMFREQRQYGNDPELVRRSKTKFDAPLKWRDGRLVFTCSWSDWFHVDADPWRDEAWEIIRRSPRHTFQILTKRPGRIHRCLPADWGSGYPNVWLGVSVESAEFWNRVEVLRRIPCALRFISAEPLLNSLTRTSPYDVAHGLQPSEDAHGSPEGAWPGAGRCSLDLANIGWVIVGGESGSRRDARPMHPEWARELRDACLARDWATEQGSGDHRNAGKIVKAFDLPHDLVLGRPAFFFKQWGSWAPITELAARGIGPRRRDRVFRFDDGTFMAYVGSSPKAGGDLLDGQQWDEIPGRLTPA